MSILKRSQFRSRRKWQRITLKGMKHIKRPQRKILGVRKPQLCSNTSSFHLDLHLTFELHQHKFCQSHVVTLHPYIINSSFAACKPSKPREPLKEKSLQAKT